MSNGIDSIPVGRCERCADAPALSPVSNPTSNPSEWQCDTCRTRYRYDRHRGFTMNARPGGGDYVVRDEMGHYTVFRAPSDTPVEAFHADKAGAETFAR